MKIIRGSELSEKNKRQVLRGYPYRLTYENKERITKVYESRGWTPLPPDEIYMTDEQWLFTHGFHVTNSGKLSKSHNSCTYLGWEK